MSDEILTKITTLEDEISRLKREQAKISRRLKLVETERDELKSHYNFERSKRESERDWAGETFQWAAKAQEILEKRFSLKEFRPKQLAAVNATLSKKDVLLLMPTGGGKSLVYQLPALIENGLTVVISPLLSLIEDQILALRKLEVEAEALNSSSGKEVKKTIYDYMGKGVGRVRLVYVTPEWVAKSKMFMSYLQKCHAAKRLDRIAIDEVHCCSQWGHDFRPDYKFLGLLRNMFPDVPFLGLTATATMSVLLDVQNMLEMQGCVIFKAPFNRPNLFYRVVQKPAQAETCYDYLERLLTTKYNDQSGIIYTTTIKDCEELTKNLRNRGLKVKHYHANLETDQRSSTHDKWLSNKYQAVIATVAFGMGIDKPDVRFVIHHTMPKSMESFYQESGRAGRDGRNADCILMYRLADFLRNSAMANSKTEEKNVYSVLEYCLEAAGCRRSAIAKHFEEVWDANQCDKMCDHCKKPKETQIYDITPLCRDIFTIIDKASDSGVNLTLIKLLDAWFQTGVKDLRVSSVKKPNLSRDQAENVVGFLLLKGFLREEKNYTAYTVNCYIQKKVASLEGATIEMASSESLGLKRIGKKTDCEESGPSKRLKTN